MSITWRFLIKFDYNTWNCEMKYTWTDQYCTVRAHKFKVDGPKRSNIVSVLHK
jgi:hypothetical protein